MEHFAGGGGGSGQGCRSSEGTGATQGGHSRVSSVISGKKWDQDKLEKI